MVKDGVVIILVINFFCFFCYLKFLNEKGSGIRRDKFVNYFYFCIYMCDKKLSIIMIKCVIIKVILWLCKYCLIFYINRFLLILFFY